MREVTGRRSHSGPVLTGGHRRGALHAGFAVAVSGALVATAALAGPAALSPAHPRYTFTLIDRKVPSPAPRQGRMPGHRLRRQRPARAR